MPNWCMNNAVLTAPDKKSATAFAAYLKEKEGADWLSYFLPVPESEAENWYSWNVTNWGTKWDCKADWKRKSQTFTLIFDSAWSPPIALYEHLCEEGWSVEAFYYEPGMNFCGKFYDGNDDYYEIPATSDEVVEEIPSDIDEMYSISERMSEDEEFEDEEGDDDE